MTEPAADVPAPKRAARPPQRRASKRELRTWAWVAGGIALFAPWAAIAAAPKPAPHADGGDAARPIVIVRRITRRIIIAYPSASGPVRIGADDASSAGSNGGTEAAAPPPPATTSTGGS